MKTNNIQKLVLYALFIALTVVFTTFISIPIGSQGGYINLGDSIIIIASIILGPVGGMIVGAIGSMISDLILAPQYAIFTFFIKGIEGLLIGLLNKKLKVYVSSLIGLLFMVIGYYFVGVIMYESFILPLIDTAFNLIQMAVCFIVSLFILSLLKKAKIKELNK